MRYRERMASIALFFGRAGLLHRDGHVALCLEQLFSGIKSHAEAAGEAELGAQLFLNQAS